MVELSRRHDSVKKFLSEAKLEEVHKAASTLILRPIKIGEASPLSEGRMPESKSQFMESPILRTPPAPEQQVPPVEEKREEIKGEERKEVAEEKKEPNRESTFFFGESRTSWFPERRKRFEDRESVMRRFVLLWIGRVQGHELIGKYVNLWRKWLIKRKAVETSAAFMLKRLIYGEKSWAFDKLRNAKRAGLKAFEEVPRSELVTK